MEQVGSVSLFLDNAASLVDAPEDVRNLDSANDLARVQTARASIVARDTHDGIISGSIEGVRGGIAERVADNRDSKEARAARDSKKADDTLFYLTLMQSGDFDAYIAENIFSGMGDQEILDLVSKIEAETGGSFEEYAKDVLGDLPERLPHESDVEYQRRVLTAIAEEVLENGEIKAEYADDPVARFIRDHEFRKEAVAAVKDKDQRVENGENFNAVHAEVKNEAQSDMVTANEYGRSSKTEEFKIEGRAGQDSFSDTDASAAATSALSESFLDRFPATSKTLAAASKDVKEQFATASTDETKVQQHDVKVDFDNRMT